MAAARPDAEDGDGTNDAINDDPLPETLTLEQAYRAAFYMVDQYIALEQVPDEGLAWSCSGST